MKQHKHAELIKAWADGAEIEGRITESGNEWQLLAKPCWFSDDYIEYRIKPKSKPDFTIEYFFKKGELLGAHKEQPPNLSLTFDGETGELKSAEVLK